MRVLAAYTIASLLLNYVHGLIPALHTEAIRWGRLADWNPANWALVLLATSLPVGSIYFGSDLVAKVLHHKPESADSEGTGSGRPVAHQAGGSDAGRAPRSGSVRAESGAVKVDEAPVPGPTEADESAGVARPLRSDAAPQSGGPVAPRRSTSRVSVTAKSAPERNRTDTELLEEARLLTATWNDELLTATRLRGELRIGQTRARSLRDQLRSERAGRLGHAARDSVTVEPSNGPGEAASQQQSDPHTVRASAA